MDSLEANSLPPPAYSEEEFDQKMSRATDLSLKLAKWETPDVEIDEEGFPRYDPAMYDEPPRAQKGKDQPATTTFRSSSITKRPLPNPKSSASSSNAGPSTLRQTQPLHISKKSISKAEEAAQDTTRYIPASTPSIKHTPEDIPPYAAQDLPLSAPSLQSIPAQGIDDIPEDNPPYTAIDPHVSTSSVPIQNIDDTPEDNPPYELNHPTDLPYAEQPQQGNWEEGTTLRQDVISEPVPDEALDRPQSSEFELTENLRQGHETLNSNTVATANQILDRYSMAPNAPFHRGPQLLNTNTATMSNQMDSQSRFSMASNPPFHRGPQSLNPNTATMSNQDSQSRYSMASNPPFHRGPQLLNTNTATMSNQMDSQSRYSMASYPPLHGSQSLNPNTASMSDQNFQYSMAPNPPVNHGPQQHFSLLPAPRILPRIHPSDRPRSHSMSPPSTSPQPTTTPRVLFNPIVAYGKNVMGGQPQFRPKVHTPQSQTPFQAPYDPTTFYNSAVSSHLSTSMTIVDQSPHLPNQRGQVRPNQTYSTPANSAVNQPRQWGWHPPGRPSNTYRPVTGDTYGGLGGGTGVSRHSQYSVTNNGYFSQ